MIALFCLFLTLFASPFKSKSRLEAENAALRHQLIVLKRRVRGRATGLRIVMPKSIIRPLLRLKPVATSPGWKQFAVTPVPSRRRASSR